MRSHTSNLHTQELFKEEPLNLEINKKSFMKSLSKDQIKDINKLNNTKELQKINEDNNLSN